MQTFVEVQRFRQWWVWLIMLISVLLVAVVLTVDNGWASLSGWIPIMILCTIILLIYSWRLDTRCDPEGIHYRVWPFMTWRIIRWSDVSQASVTSYGFVGYGVRWNFGEWVYNVGGNQGLRIKTTTNKRILLGTQRPDELQAFLDNLHVF